MSDNASKISTGLRSSKMVLAAGTAIVLIVVCSIASTSYYQGLLQFRLGERMAQVTFPSAVPSDQIPRDALIIKRVRELMVIEDDRAPVVLQIKNADQLRTEQPEIYGQAVDGDILIIYPTLVIVYSPQKDLIVSSTRASSP